MVGMCLAAGYIIAFGAGLVWPRGAEAAGADRYRWRRAPHSGSFPLPLDLSVARRARSAGTIAILARRGGYETTQPRNMVTPCCFVTLS